jgi:hypothetical protein
MNLTKILALAPLWPDIEKAIAVGKRMANDPNIPKAIAVFDQYEHDPELKEAIAAFEKLGAALSAQD